MRGTGFIPSTPRSRGTIRLHFERTDIPALLASSLAPLVKQASARETELRVEGEQTIPRVFVDREKLAWAVTTLAGNALRYVASGGIVVVRVAHEQSAEALHVLVQDNGPGIPPERMQSLFERRLGAPHADALALGLVRDVVGAHGGRIAVESSVDLHDHGTTVSLVLPSDPY